MPSYLLLNQGGNLLLNQGGALLLHSSSTTAITRWEVRPHTGGKSLTWTPIAALSDQPIVVIVKGDDFQGGTVVASSASGRMAVLLPDVEPTSGDWSAVTWRTDSTTTPPTYRALGGSPLDRALVVGSDYVVWLELTDSAGITVARVSGLLPIY